MFLIVYTEIILKCPVTVQCMRSLVDRCGSGPENSGPAPGTHVAFSFVINGYLNKVKGFWDVSQYAIV